MKNSLLLAVCLGLTGCAYPISSIDTSKVSPEAANQCLNGYNQCMAGGPAVGIRAEQNKSCHDSFQVCIKVNEPRLTLNK